jgi:hypothetical protein
VRHLHAALADAGELEAKTAGEMASGRYVVFGSVGRSWVLVLPDEEITDLKLPVDAAMAEALTSTDLRTGMVSRVDGEGPIPIPANPILLSSN